MHDMDFTKPQAQHEPASSAPFKTGNSPYYDAEIATQLFRASGKEERFAPGQTLFAEDEKTSKGGLFRAGSRMYLLTEGEVALTIGGRALDTVNAGEVFGEMAVISERPRSATATALKACAAFSLDASELQSAIVKTPEFALMLMSVMFDRLRFLMARLAARKAVGGAGREGPVFDPKLLAQFESALERSAIVRFWSGATVMREGQAGAYMYIVKAGRIAVTVRGELVETVNPGGTFGEMALVDQSPRTATATAETECELLQVDRTSLLDAVKKQPAFAMAMMRAVADRLRHMNSQLSSGQA